MRTLILILLVALAQIPATAQTKRAFIVGVSDYQELTRLDRTITDAEGYADVFSNDLGFQVTPLNNPTTEVFLSALDSFVASIEPGDQIAFVFSGHGWSDGAENYLALQDAPEQSSEFTLKRLTVALQADVLDELTRRRPELVLAIIDACRDNPFNLGTKSVTKGLVPQQTVPGTLVVYAAGSRQKALERLSPSDPSPYSLFTRNLLPKLRDPSAPLMRIVDAARTQTAEMANQVSHPQRPAIYSDVSLDFCFGACRRNVLADEEAQALIQAFRDNSIPTWEEFVARFPRSTDLDLAEQRLSELRRKQVEELDNEFRMLQQRFDALKTANADAETDQTIRTSSGGSRVGSTALPEQTADCASFSQEFSVYFEWDSSAITSAGMAVVDQAVRNVGRAPDNCRVTRVTVEGHTDSSGSQDYNLRSSESQATAVATALIALGINSSAIESTGFGETRPAVDRGDGVREPRNRRTEVRINVGP